MVGWCYPSPTLGCLPLPTSPRSLSPILALTFMPPYLSNPPKTCCGDAHLKSWPQGARGRALGSNTELRWTFSRLACVRVNWN